MTHTYIIIIIDWQVLDRDALATWAAVAAGICVSYLVMTAVRWRVFAKSKAEAIKRRARTLTARP